MDFNTLFPIHIHARRPTLSGLIIDLLLAVLSVAAMTAILVFLKDVLNTPIVALLYLLPVLISTAFWGLAPGILASIGAFLAFNYFFLLPHFTLIVHNPQDVIALFVFLIVAVVTSNLVGRVKSSLAEVQAGERVLIHLYEMSVDLAGVRDRSAIAHMLAEKLSAVFEPAVAEVSLFKPKGVLAFRSPDSRASQGVPSHILPLAAARGALGEVRLWAHRSLNDNETRLLHALIGQAALALERTLLAQAETRATILEESDRLKTALLSSVSHELRTPLVTIKAAATSLRSGAVRRDSEAADELLAALEEEADRLNQFVANLLNMSRIEAGALHPKRQWNMLAEIVDSTITDLRSDAEGHTLEVDVSEDLPLVPVDHVLMQQVFKNLLSNSLKYAPPGTAVRVSATIDPAKQLLVVQVRNEGPHVPREHLEHIFDKFHRVTDADRIAGTGLGLSICKGIVEAHGGRIWAENLPGGFAFNFTLPLTRDGAEAPKMPADSETV